MRTTDRIRELFATEEPGPVGLEADAAAEILLVARWFRLRPREQKRAMSPDEWLSRRGAVRE